MEISQCSPRIRALLAELEEPLPGLRPLVPEECPALLALYEGNPFYNRVTLDDPPTLESCKEDAEALPPGRSPCHKLFLGLWQGGTLQAVWDLVEGYPEEGTLYVGLLELAGAFQGRGLGTNMMTALIAQGAAAGFSALRLACLEKNEPGLRFWTSLGFEEEGRAPWQGGRTALKLVRRLEKP